MSRMIFCLRSSITILVLYIAPTLLFAQLPQVKAGLAKITENELQVALLPDGDFDDVVSSALITIRYASTPGVTVGSPQIVAGNWPAGLSVIDQGTFTNGGFTYRSFYYDDPTLQYLSASGNGWIGGVIEPFFNVPVTNISGTCVEFQLIDDAFQEAENIQWYISLNGQAQNDGYIGGSYSGVQFHPVINTTTQVGYCTIQSAINAATAGDVISIAAGTYAENITLNKDIELIGTGSTSIVSPVTPCSGDGVTITASGASITSLDFVGFNRAIVVQANNVDLTDVGGLSSCATGLELGNGINNLTVQSCRLNNNTSVGIRAGTSVSVSDMLIIDTEIKGNNQGVFVAASSTPPPFNNITFQNCDLSDNLIKGIYMERGNNVMIDGIIMNNSGTSATYGFNNGIDINLKFGNYSGFTIQNSTFTNCGAQGTAAALDNPAVIAIKARDDGSYSGNPASLSNVLVKNNTIHGPRNGLRLGEFGTVVNAGAINFTIEQNNFDHPFANKALINNTNSNANLICNWHGNVDISSTIGYGNGTGTFNLISYADDAFFSNCSDPVTVVLVDHTDLDCYETHTGAIDVAVTGGVSGYDNTWTGPDGFTSSIEDLAGLAAGTYDLIVTDGFSSAEFQITLIVLDATPPTIACPSSIIVPTDPNSCTATGLALDPIIGDNCLLPLHALSFTLSGAMVQSETVGSASAIAFDQGTTTVQYTVRDSMGFTSTCSFTVEVDDSQSPTLACPSDKTVSTDPDQCTASLSSSLWPEISDNCTPIFTTTYTLSGATNGSGSMLWPYDSSAHLSQNTIVFSTGTTTVTYVISDEEDNQSTCSFDVTVIDGQAPLITCPGDITIDTEAGGCTAVVNAISSVINENCDFGTTWVMSSPTGGNGIGDASGTIFQKGTTIVTYTITETNSPFATGTCSFTVTVEDNEVPSVIAGTIGSCYPTADAAQAAAIAATTSTDNCSSVPGITYTASTIGTCEAIVTVIAEDESGNTNSIQYLTRIDNVAPTFTAPDDISIGSDVTCSFDASIGVTGDVTDETDNCSPLVEASFTDQITPGTCPGSWTIARTWSLADECGNAATPQIQIITVNDLLAPSLTAGTINGEYATIAEAEAAAIAATAANDNCTPSNDLVFSASTSGDCAIVVTVTVSDGCGNSAQMEYYSSIAYVPTQITFCPTVAPATNAFGTCAANVNVPAPAWTDNCDDSNVLSYVITGAGVTSGPSAGTGAVGLRNFSVGTSTVTYSVSDGITTVTCEVIIVVNDNQTPIITCPLNQTYNSDPGECFATVSIAPTSATDNCPLPTNTYSYRFTGTSNSPGHPAFIPGTINGLQFIAGVYTITYRVSDAANLTSTCNFQITVNDTSAPEITCAPTVNAFTEIGLCSATLNWAQLAPAIVSNTCDELSYVAKDEDENVLSQGSAPFTSITFPTGTNTISYTLTETNTPYRVVVCTMDVIISEELPTIACAPPLEVSADAGQCGASSVLLAIPIAADNCGVATLSNNAPSTFPLGNTIVTWTVTDVNGNSATCDQTVTVTDDEAPSFAGCPSDISVVNDPGDCGGATVFWNAPNASDNCGGTITTTDPSWISGDFFPIGITTVIYTAEDVHGNIGTCSFTVEVFILDADDDGTCDEFDLCAGGPEPGTPCEDGDPGTMDDVITAGCACVGTPHLDLHVRMFLDGPYNETTDLMSDNLRVQGLLPIAHPYAGSPFNHTGTETIAPSVFTTSGDDAIVDWVLIELRDANTPSVVIASRAALLQRDGDVVDLDGTSVLRFVNLTSGDHHVAVRHRNHLGTMTASAVTLSHVASMIDFTDTNHANYGTDPSFALSAQKDRDGHRILWSGNVVQDHVLKYSGASNDRDPILVSIGGLVPTTVVMNVYATHDVNLDGSIKYAGSNNDRDPILANLNGIVIGQRFQQLP